MSFKRIFSWQRVLPLCLIILSRPVCAQKKAERQLYSSLSGHLARLTTGGAAQKAYLGESFRALGLTPRGASNGYFEPFIMDEGLRFEPGTSLAVNGEPLRPGKDFFPLSYSGQGKAQGTPLVSVQEPRQPWIIDLSNYFDSPPPDSVLRDSLYRLARAAVSDQAAAVLFCDPKGSAPSMDFRGDPSREPVAVPVLYVSKGAASRFFGDAAASVRIALQVSLVPQKDTAYSVLGGIDNGAASTIVVAARTPADQAMLLGAAGQIKDNRAYSHHNYLFVALPSAGGDRLRRIVSADLSRASAFLCALMLDSAAGTHLSVRGTASSPAWPGVLSRVRLKAPLAGSLPDADSTFAADMPVLCLSGSVPSRDPVADDAQTVHYVCALLQALDRKEKKDLSPAAP